MTKYNFRYNNETLVRKSYLIVTCVTVALAVFAALFIKHILNIESKSAEVFLQQSVLQTASNFKIRINNDINSLEVLSANLSLSAPSFDKNEILNFIKTNVLDPKYNRLGFAYSNGNAVRYQVTKDSPAYIDWAQESCFQTALSGQACFAKTIQDSDSVSGYLNKYFVPVYNKSKKIVGVLGILTDSDVFRKILLYNTYDGQGYSRVVNSNGDFIIKSRIDKNIHSNFFDKNLLFIGTDKEQIIKSFKNQKSGTFRFKYADDGKVYIAAFATININDALILTDVPEDVLLHNIKTILYFILFVVLLLTFLLLALLKYLRFVDKQKEIELSKVAFVDEVTQSINKTKFLIDARANINACENDNFAMLSMDITKFKVINELYGYKTANKILKDIYSLLISKLPENSICARDFAATYVILYKYKEQKEIIDYINNICLQINNYNETVMQNLSTSLNIRLVSKLSVIFGIFLITDRNIFIEQMCDRASIAKRNAKNIVTDKYHFYDDCIRAKVLQDKSIEDEMYSALNNNQFKMFLQPKFSLNTMELTGAEALVRWFHPIRGIVAPAEFIPLFESNGFIMELDKCIWTQACEFLSARKKSGEMLFPISVNVSRLHLNNDAFIEELVKLVNNFEIEPKYLELELTETACLNNEKLFIDIVNKLKEKGFSIAMDDFGTGYSSLNMLRHLPVDILKLDRGFITDSVLDEKGQTVIKCVIDLADKLNMVTVAEGVETPDQVLFLKKAGCKIVQGFLYGRPMDVDKFTQTFLSGENSICQYDDE